MPSVAPERVLSRHTYTQVVLVKREHGELNGLYRACPSSAAAPDASAAAATSSDALTTEPSQHKLQMMLTGNGGGRTALVERAVSGTRPNTLVKVKDEKYFALCCDGKLNLLPHNLDFSINIEGGQQLLQNTSKQGNQFGTCAHNSSL